MFSQDERERYQRHFALPGFGLEKQKELKKSSVLLIGAGGLGSPAALYLVAAGLGRLGLVDHDRVDLSNLQRQILYGTQDLGYSKVVAAKRRLNDLNPHVDLKIYTEKLTTENALNLFHEYDLILDGTDNFATRYLVNDAAIISKKPYLFASIRQFKGQITLFATENGPCYRCLYPEPPPAELVPDCVTGGVLGVLPGIIGTLQASEAVKYLTSSGESLGGKLLIFDALNTEFKKIHVEKDPDCPACSHQLNVLQASYSSKEGSSVDGISSTDLKNMMLRKDDFLLLDVRELFEYEMKNLSGVLIPLAQLSDRLFEIMAWKDKPIVVHCQSGARSERAMEILKKAGFSNVRNLEGGLARF